MPGRGQVAVRVEVRPHLLCAALLVCCDSCHSHAALLCAVIGLHPVPRLSQEAIHRISGALLVPLRPTAETMHVPTDDDLGPPRLCRTVQKAGAHYSTYPAGPTWHPLQLGVQGSLRLQGMHRCP